MTSVFASRKNLSNKVTCSTREKSFSNSRNEGFIQKYVSTRQKKSFPRQQSLKTYKKWLAQTRNFFSINLNEALVEEYVSIIQKNCFFWQENQRKWFWKCFSLKLVPPNFNNGYQHQKKSSEQKHSVSTRQKISFHQPE